MLFHTATFAIFLSILILIVSRIGGRWLFALLMVSSYVFYGWAQPQYLLLIFGTSIIDYWVSNWFVNRPHLKRPGIIISAIGNFGVLAYFKYANFFIANFQATLSAMGIHADPIVLNIILPIGISFHTFQSFCYIVDVLTGKFPPCKSPVLFLLYVCYFPQLVAGPIERANQLIPQLAKIPEMRAGMAGRVCEATALFAEGWLRKAFADWMAITASSFFSRNPADAKTAEAMYGIIAFGLQIYGDFSGYTRMAQGISWLLGVRLMENFNIPYVAVSFRDFWARWHISLSRWFRDYLYIPLGGNRKGEGRTYAALAITMLVSGLWHGANWTFVLWGGMHGTFVVVERFCRKLGITLPDSVSRPIVLVLAFLAWVPFRAASVGDTMQVYLALGHGGWGLPPLNVVLGLLGLIGCDLVTRERRQRIEAAESQSARVVPATAEAFPVGMAAAACSGTVAASAPPPAAAGLALTGAAHPPAKASAAPIAAQGEFEDIFSVVWGRLKPMLAKLKEEHPGTDAAVVSGYRPLEWNTSFTRAVGLMTLCIVTLWIGTIFGHDRASTFIYFQF